MGARVLMGEPHIVSIAEIRAAADRIRGVATRTPLLRWDDTTWLKPESLQPVGAFKMRGAYNKIASLTDEERARGVVTYSSGNHAQAVARAARLLGAKAVICMPRDAPRVKIEGVERDGAEIQFTGPDSEERHALALRLVEERGLVMVEPYDDPAIIAGQGTIGLEIVEDLPEVTSVLVPVSGGGLSAGVATAIKALRPDGPGHRRRAGARGRCEGIAGVRRARDLDGGARPAARWPTGCARTRSARCRSSTSGASWTRSSPSPRTEMADAMRQLAHRAPARRRTVRRRRHGGRTCRATSRVPTATTRG